VVPSDKNQTTISYSTEHNGGIRYIFYKEYYNSV